MNPLGPFLGKNFATTISPWIVTMEALAPYRHAVATGRRTNPQPLAYLDRRSQPRSKARSTSSSKSGCETRAAPRRRRSAPTRLSHTSFKHQYWTVAQMVAHHTVGGCNLQPGDLLGSGTISGPDADQAGAMIELSRGGPQPADAGRGNGATEQRGFLQDGDAVILKGWCEKPGAARIGFGENRGTVLPAIGT